jgi:hypothetical protein
MQVKVNNPQGRPGPPFKGTMHALANLPAAGVKERTMQLTNQLIPLLVGYAAVAATARDPEPPLSVTTVCPILGPNATATAKRSFRAALPTFVAKLPPAEAEAAAADMNVEDALDALLGDIFEED